MKNLNLVFFGNSKYSVIGGSIIHKKFPLSMVVTKPLIPSPVKDFAIKNNIPILEADSLDEENIKKIASFKPDFLIVEDYGLILPKKLLDLPTIASLNIHHSLLPKYRGPSPAPTTILNGDKVSGVTIIEMTEEVDSGPIVAQKEYPLSEDETTDSLLTKLNTLGGELLVEVVPQYLNGSIKPIKQDRSQASYTKHLKKEDGYFEIENPPDPEKLDRMIRAYFPWPTVWSKWKGKIVKFFSGGLVQMEGKKPVPLKDFLNGYPDFPIKS